MIKTVLIQSQNNHTLTKATPKAVTKEAMYYKAYKGKTVQCQLCFRQCIIPDGSTGFCRVRQNRKGKLYPLVYSLPAAVQVDPVEKEPQYHFLPGTEILCFGTVGCNFACKHCHNWHLSQASPGDCSAYLFPPEKAVQFAIKSKIPTISFTYNDPTIFYEYVLDIAKIAQKKGIRIIWHSNGAMNPEPLKELLKYTDGVTIDIKGFTEKAYENSSAKLEPVLRTLKTIKKHKVWLELVNLVIPTINDDPDDIRNMCKWIKDNLGTDVPLHFSRFFPNYKLTHISPTPIKTLEKAYKIAEETGIKYATIGNVPGHKYNSTFCPECNKKIIYRTHFEVLENNIKNGKCKFCGHKISGVWK